MESYNTYGKLAREEGAFFGQSTEAGVEYSLADLEGDDVVIRGRG